MDGEGERTRELIRRRAATRRPVGPTALAVGLPGAETLSMATRDGMTILDSATCLRLLGSQEVGRLAVSVAYHPDIFPINYVVDDATIVFRTAEGTKLAAAFIGHAVAFEADGYDADTGDAWSVVVKGHAEEIAMHDMLEDTAFPVFPWSAGPKSRFMRVVPDEISGRRFHVIQRRSDGDG